MLRRLRMLAVALQWFRKKDVLSAGFDGWHLSATSRSHLCPDAIHHRGDRYGVFRRVHVVVTRRELLDDHGSRRHGLPGSTLPGGAPRGAEHVRREIERCRPTNAPCHLMKLAEVLRSATTARLVGFEACPSLRNGLPAQRPFEECACDDVEYWLFILRGGRIDQDQRCHMFTLVALLTPAPITRRIRVPVLRRSHVASWQSRCTATPGLLGRRRTTRGACDTAWSPGSTPCNLLCLAKGPDKEQATVDPSFWWLFPVAIIIAAVANGAGIGGATFFAPLFVIAIGLEPATAVGVALGTEVFGFTSGVIAHARAGAIDWRIVRVLALVSVPAAIVGSLLAGAAPESLLKLLLATALAGVALVFVRHHDPVSENAEIAAGIGVVDPAFSSRLVLADDTTYEYDVCRPSDGRIGAGIGGLFVGLVSTGLGEANSFTLVKRCRIPARIAVAVSVTTVAVTALAASVTHAFDFASSPNAEYAEVMSILVFTVPGVVIGGQLGPRVVGRLPEQTLIRTLGWVFLLISALTAFEALS